jgi:hypothetical protein
MGPRKNCEANNLNGEPCGSSTLIDSEFCFFHSPEMAEERQRASSAGGIKTVLKTLPATAQSTQINNAGDILGLIAETINHVRTGQLDTRIANCVGYLSGVALKAIEQGKIEDRIEALEIIVKNNNTRAQKGFRVPDNSIFSLEDKEG